MFCSKFSLISTNLFWNHLNWLLKLWLLVTQSQKAAGRNWIFYGSLIRRNCANAWMHYCSSILLNKDLFSLIFIISLYYQHSSWQWRASYIFSATSQLHMHWLHYQAKTSFRPVSFFFIPVRPIRRAIIHSAIREWEEFTCIRFKERRYEKDYIEFFVGKG